MSVFKTSSETWGSPWLDPAIYELEETGSLPGLENLMNRSVLRGGKRLRPILMGEFAGLFGLSADRVKPFARAAEQVHSATLAHDDVIDASETRRGIRTLNARIENRRAVLGGDYLLAEGIFHVARQGHFKVVEALSETLRELVTGELLQNEARGMDEVTEAHLLRIADLKTGSLFRWCCSVPALLLDSSPEVLRLVRDFATRLGVAFQWIDDALDYSKESGKPYGQDLREGLVNEVTRRLIEKFPESRDSVKSILQNESEFSLPWSETQIATEVENVRQSARSQLETARRILADLRVVLRREEHPASDESMARVEKILEKLERREK